MAPEGALSKRAELARGWALLLASGVGIGVGVSALIQYTLGVFMGPLTHEFGWTRAQVAGATVAKAAALLGVSVGIGALADRYGERRIALASQIMLGGGLIAMSLMPGNLWALYFGYGLLVVIGAGTLPMIWTKMIIRWFLAARGLALGLALMFTGLIGSLTPSYANWAIERFGWRESYIALACLPLLLGFPLTFLFFRDPPGSKPRHQGGYTKDSAPGYRLREALSTRCFWQMGLSFFVGTIGVLGLMVHSLPMLTDRGLQRDQAAAVVGLFGIAVSVGRLATGALLDLFPPERIVAALLLMPLIACAILLSAGNNIVLCATAIILIGFTTGMEADASAFLVAQYFGERSYSSIYGLMFAITIAGGAVGPVAIGWSYDLKGDYNLALLSCAFTFTVASILVVRLKPPVKKEISGDS